MEIITIILIAVVFYLVMIVIFHKIIAKFLKLMLFGILAAIIIGIAYFFLK